MSLSLSCREVGMECYFLAEGETEQAVFDSFMRHVHMEHSEDWFEIEEIYQVACSILHEKAA